jgi:hypothetical protein
MQIVIGTPSAFGGYTLHAGGETCVFELALYLCFALSRLRCA